mgnify:FL=1
MISYQKSGYLLAPMILLFLTTSVSAQNTSVNALQLSPDSEALDIYVGDERLFESLEFGEVAEETDISSGTREVKAVPAGSEPINARSILSFNFRENNSYTIVTRNNAPFIQTTVVLNDQIKPPEGESRLRLAHFSPDLLNIDLEAENGNSYSVENLGYTSTSSYRNISSGNYTITASNPTTGRELFSDDIELRENRTYTGFITGTSFSGFQIVTVTEEIRETEEQTDNGETETENGEEEQDLIAFCNVISEEPRRVDCRIFS